jgi:hypothetical protein
MQLTLSACMEQQVFAPVSIIGRLGMRVQLRMKQGVVIRGLHDYAM